MLAWIAYGDQWNLNHKVTFDGEAKLITVSPTISEIDVKNDVYSSWKEWSLLYDNLKFASAMRVIGGDPIGGGQYAGDLYFMINGWRLKIDHTFNITGVIFSDDYASPFYSDGTTSFVTNKVSSLVLTQGITTASGSTSPTADEIATAVWNRVLSTVTAGQLLQNVAQTVDDNQALIIAQ